jgi:hypothetical protein
MPEDFGTIVNNSSQILLPLEISKETSKKNVQNVGGAKDFKGFSNMLGISKSTAYNSTASIRSVASFGIRANAFEHSKYPSKVQPKKEFETRGNPYIDSKNKK